MASFSIGTVNSTVDASEEFKFSLCNMLHIDDLKQL